MIRFNPSAGVGRPAACRRRSRALALVLSLTASCALPLAAAPAAAPAPAREADVQGPQVEEVRAAIQRGVDWLLAHQNSNGWWSTPDQPAVTGLVLTALNREPSGRFLRNRPSELNRAYDYILGSVRPDGSIYRVGLANYNTALCLIALSTANDPAFLPVIRAAREHIADSQVDMGEPGRLDTPFDGGVGYGSRYLHSDMNNTLMAVEAMRWSEAALPPDAAPGTPPTRDLNWKAVAHFLQNCQNLPSHNSAEWVSEDPRDHGGFVYYPGNTKSDSVTNAQTGRVSLRSYGSISYAGLLSYIYARVEKNDPRVVAVLDWLRKNYTLEENPGMGEQGYYYYLHLMTKALTAAGVSRLETEEAPSGGVDWRKELARRLLELQEPDGSWVNPTERWWESDRCLVTSYVLLSLEMLHSAMTEG